MKCRHFKENLSFPLKLIFNFLTFYFLFIFIQYFDTIIRADDTSTQPNRTSNELL